jgi:heptosyltransferase II
MKVESILIVSFSHIGDVVLSTAVIPPLQRHFPDAQINILVGPKSWEILWGDVRLNEIIIYDNKKQHKGLAGRINLIRELRNKNFDLVVDLRDSLWARFIGGIHWGMPSFQRFSQGYRELHAVDRYLDILQANGIKDANDFPEIILQNYEKQEAIDFLTQNKVKPSDTIIGMHPGGSWQYKLWPLERFASLGDFLSIRYNAKLLVFAGPDEKTLQSQMYDLMRVKPILIDNISLRMLASLIQRCNLYIGNDTGPMHIAAAVGTRVVSMFGSTNARRSGPYGNGHVIISTRLECAPCHPGNSPGGCKRGTCLAMDSISLDQVANIVERVLNEQREWHIPC